MEDFKELTTEQKELIDKILLNELDMLWRYCTSSSGQNLDSKILGHVVYSLLHIKKRGKYYTKESGDSSEQDLLNEFRNMYLRLKK